MKLVELINMVATAFSKLFNVWGWNSTTSIRKRILIAKVDGSLKTPVSVMPLVDTLQGRLSKPRYNPDEHDALTPEELGGVENIVSIEFDEEAFYKYCPYITRPNSKK